MKSIVIIFALFVGTISFASSRTDYNQFNVKLESSGNRINFTLGSQLNTRLVILTKVRPLRKCLTNSGTGPVSCSSDRVATFNDSGNTYMAFQKDSEVGFGGAYGLNLNVSKDQVSYTNNTKIVIQVPNLNQKLGGLLPFEQIYKHTKVSFYCDSISNCYVTFENLFGLTFEN